MTSYLEAFRARTSAQPGKEPASQESAPGCGDTWPASLARYDRDRVDRMAAALISGIHTIMAEKDIAAWAIKQVDAIDKALAEREVPQVSKGDNT